MQLRLNLLAVALLLVGTANADGGEVSGASNSAKRETTSVKTTQDSLAQANATSESRYEQDDDSDDCN